MKANPCKKTCLRLLVATSLFVSPVAVQGQELSLPKSSPTKPFSHLDLSLTTGTTGIGLDASMPLSDVVSLRAGYAIMPHIKKTMHFGVEVGEDPAESERKFNKLSGMLETLTGNKVDNVVDMIGQPTYWNWKLLVDVKPLRDKRWHLTAGVFMGSHEIAKAVNSIEDMASLMAVSIYNTMYYRAVNDEPLIVVGSESVRIPYLKERLLDYGRMSIHIGDYKHDVLYEEDVVSTKGMFIDGEYFPAGTVLHKAGDPDDPLYRKGDPYRIVPDENSMVRAWAYANRLKPYVGFGYGGQLSKKDPKWKVSFDCGAMFWGGTPQIITHDGTDLVNDVENVRGKVGDYVNIIKKFKVFPVLNFRLTRTIF